jgi:purine-binding chemotaxis protein CheW
MQTITPVENSRMPKDSAHDGKYLTFTLGNESYGIEVLKVREIIQMQSITHVVKMPDFIKGVINLRGKIIPVIDLRAKFDLSDGEITNNTCIIVVNYTNHNNDCSQIGIIVDGVEEVLNISSKEIEAPPQFGSGLQSEYILGMAKVRGIVKTLLDIDQVLNVDHILTLE